jgi:acetyltransferase-like isoleucine patch superfamily enzyme
MQGSRVRRPAEDPLALFPRLLTYLRTCWMHRTYPFRNFGKSVSMHYSCELRRSAAPDISIGNNVYLAPGVWLSVLPDDAKTANPKIELQDGCKIGRRSVIAARSRICLESDVLLAPNVLIQDHNHEYSNPALPIHAQGVTTGGTITIEKNSWIGYGAAIISAKGHLVVGQNSVVGAHTVLTRSIPAYSVVAGSPARILRQYDLETGQWARVAGTERLEEAQARQASIKQSGGI